MFKKSAFILGLLIFSLGSFAKESNLAKRYEPTHVGVHSELDIDDGSSEKAVKKAECVVRDSHLLEDSKKPLPTADDSIAAYPIPAVTAVVLAVTFIGYKMHAFFAVNPVAAAREKFALAKLDLATAKMVTARNKIISN